MNHKKERRASRERERDPATASVPTPERPAQPLQVPSTSAAASMVAVVEALFDIHLDEKQGARPTLAPLEIAQLVGLDRLIGIVGRCLIPGCDVHFLSRDLQIITHIEELSPIDTALSRARSYWASPHPAAVAVLVYLDRASILLMDGTEIPLR